MYLKISILLFFVSVLTSAQQLYKCETVKTDFFSSAPIEDIHALSKKGISVLNGATGEISFRIPIRSFEFRKSKMQEHFNENFMESDKYPYASFKGQIKEYVDLSKDGEYPVTISGVLDIHGKKKVREVPSTILIRNGKVSLKSTFKIACKDHDIDIPQILWKNIAEVLEVEVDASYTKL